MALSPKAAQSIEDKCPKLLKCPACGEAWDSQKILSLPVANKPVVANTFTQSKKDSSSVRSVVQLICSHCCYCAFFSTKILE